MLYANANVLVAESGEGWMIIDNLEWWRPEFESQSLNQVGVRRNKWSVISEQMT